jgi:tetratricopeptide (TPR) repeat protein
MSLLMDALKKAEEAKRQAGEASAAPSAGAELTLQPVTPAPTPAPTPPGNALPNLSQQHFDSVDADLANVTTSAPPKKRSTPPAQKPARISSENEASAESKGAAERSSAQNVFAVKQAPKSRAPLWLFLGLSGIATASIGAYFWWQMQSVGGSSLAMPSSSTQSIARTPTTPAPPQAPILATAEPEKPQAKPQATPLPSLPEPFRAQTSEPPPQTEKRDRPRAPSTYPQAEPDSPIRMSTGRSKQNPTLTRAYEALLAENLSDARRDYEQVLRSDAKNTDALLGLATIAVRQGQVDNATDLYLRVLEADPKDVNAKAGLINLKGQSDPTLSESRLKTLLASQPDSATLNFALGNLQARQTRWSDAQQAYFRAHTAEPENADYLFNLAVSLDQLHQKKLAAQYYQSALNAAETRSAAFDRNQVKNRLLELRP